MAKNLLIVESPAKAKTIEKILGEDFQVKSCYGHIRDLEKDDMGIDIHKNYAPRYIVPADKQKVVKELKQLAKKRRGFQLAEAASYNLKNKNYSVACKQFADSFISGVGLRQWLSALYRGVKPAIKPKLVTQQ